MKSKYITAKGFSVKDMIRKVDKYKRDGYVEVSGIVYQDQTYSVLMYLKERR